jgi:hypothetical protein
VLALIPTLRNKISLIKKITLSLMKNSLFYLLCFFFPVVAMAQLQQISKTRFGDAQYNNAETVNVLSNGHTLVSYKRYKEGFSDWTADDPQGVLILFDEKAKMKWEKNYNAFGVKIIRSVIVAQNQKEFIIAGGYYDVKKKLDGFVMRLDSMGNVLWHKEYQKNISKIEEDKEGNFFVPLERADTINVMKLDRQGTILWEKVYSNGNYRNEYSTLCMSKDKSYFYLTYNGTTKQNPSSNPKLNDIWV